MGLLSEGNPLPWDQTKSLTEYVREHGIIQFINLYHRLKDKTGDILKFGDEVSRLDQLRWFFKSVESIYLPVLINSVRRLNTS